MSAHGAQIELALRPATRADLPGLEWFGLYTHFRRCSSAPTRSRLRAGGDAVADLNGFPVGQIFVHFTDAGQELTCASCADTCMPCESWNPSRAGGSAPPHPGSGTRAAGAGLSLERDRRGKDNPGARRLYERLSYVVFADDPGIWHYTDHEGRACRVEEPAWMLQKALTRRCSIGICPEAEKDRKRNGETAAPVQTPTGRIRRRRGRGWERNCRSSQTAAAVAEAPMMIAEAEAGRSPRGGWNCARRR